MNKHKPGCSIHQNVVQFGSVLMPTIERNCGSNTTENVRPATPLLDALEVGNPNPFAEDIVWLCEQSTRGKMQSEKWCWKMDYCKQNGLPPAQSWAWMQAEVAWQKAHPAQ